MKRAAASKDKRAFKKPRTMTQSSAPQKKANSLLFQANTVGLGNEKKEIVTALPNAGGVVGSVTFSAGTLLNHTAQGAGSLNRIGRKITMRSLYVRYSCSLAPTSLGGSPLRILIVYDKQSNAIAPAITDILVANDFNAVNNLNNSDRFITIADELTKPLSVGNNTSVAGTIYRKLGLDVIFKDTSANDITDITTGSVYAFIAQTSAVTVVTPAVLSFCRIRFTDA